MRGSVPGAYFKVSYQELKSIKHPLLATIEEKAMPYPSFEELCFLENVKSTTENEQKRVEKRMGLGKRR